MKERGCCLDTGGKRSIGVAKCPMCGQDVVIPTKEGNLSPKSTNGLIHFPPLGL